MQIGLDIADSVIKHNQERAKSSLENARKDGHICFKSKYTRRDMTVLAETCQKLAKFPSLRYFTVCENIQEISQKWLHTRVQAIVPCIPGEHVYA
jgi:hypothetical protein